MCRISFKKEKSIGLGKVQLLKPDPVFGFQTLDESRPKGDGGKQGRPNSINRHDSDGLQSRVISEE